MFEPEKECDVEFLLIRSVTVLAIIINVTILQHIQDVTRKYGEYFPKIGDRTSVFCYGVKCMMPVVKKKKKRCQMEDVDSQK